jgi:hypothetical protein
VWLYKQASRHLQANMEKVTPPALLAIYREWADSNLTVYLWFDKYKKLVDMALEIDPKCKVPQFFDWAVTSMRVHHVCSMMGGHCDTLQRALLQIRAIHEKAVARLNGCPVENQDERAVYETRATNCGRAVLDLLAYAKMPSCFNSPVYYGLPTDALNSSGAFEPLPHPTLERLCVLRAAGDDILKTRQESSTWNPCPEPEDFKQLFFTPQRGMLFNIDLV